MRLPEAYRSLSRPSSAFSAKASALRPSFLTFLLISRSTASCSVIALTSQFLMNCLFATFSAECCSFFETFLHYGITPRMSLSYLLRCYVRLFGIICVFSFQGTSLTVLPVMQKHNRLCSCITGKAPVLMSAPDRRSREPAPALRGFRSSLCELSSLYFKRMLAATCSPTPCPV